MTKKLDDLERRVHQSTQDSEKHWDRQDELWKQYKNCSDSEKRSEILKEISSNYEENSTRRRSVADEVLDAADDISRQIDEVLKS